MRELSGLLSTFLSLAACGDPDALRTTRAGMALPETLDLGSGYVGDLLDGVIVVRSTGDGPLRLLGVETEHPDLFLEWSGDPVRVAPRVAVDVALRWTPHTPGHLDAAVRVLSDAVENPVRDVRIVGVAAPLSDCSDHQCQTGVFNRTTAQCDYADREGPCDDANACTLNDHCVHGVCTGDSRVCTDDRACTRDLCDPSSGCVFPTDPEICIDDGEFCTAELCNEEGNCETTQIPNWTGCAPPTCLGIYACLDGVCTHWPITLDPSSCHQGEVDFGALFVGQTGRESFVIEATLEPLSLTRVYTAHPDLFLFDFAGMVLQVGDALEIPLEWRPQQEGTLQGEVIVETTGCESWVIAVTGSASPTPDCSDGDECTRDWFDTERGMCTWVPAPGTGCFGTRLVAGYAHTCALLDNGTVRCWGQDSSGQLGNDDEFVKQYVPVDVAGPFSSPVVAVTAGGNHTCALLETGGVACWGGNYYGQLGLADEDASTWPFPWRSHGTPESVMGLSGAVAAIAGGHYYTCALLDTGGVECWGANAKGQVGSGDTSLRRPTPTGVVGLSSGVVAVSTSGYHTCALSDAGEVLCWGANDSYQLGADTAEAFSAIPVVVAALSGSVVAISAGYDHTCALLTTGSVSCWGRNNLGQLGGGVTSENERVPMEVTGITSPVVAVSAGGRHTCALLDTGGVVCWGDNNCSKLGFEDTGPDAHPVAAPVAGLSSKALAVACGGNHSCARLDTGGLVCWGCNYEGQLGYGEYSGYESSPFAVVGIP